jgi:sterol desaturase/sphingolipid hydroxylase (fatty acid hydroxylase superfamily)
MDAANWLAHLADHRITPLWRLHTIHHSQEELSVLTSFRAHPLMHTTGFFISTLVALAMMGERSLAPALITSYVCLGTLPHANVGWSFGPLGRVIVSPAYHRRHHSAEGEHDVNLAVVLPVWDMLAGRARFPERTATPFRTGLTGRPVTVEQAGIAQRPLRVLTRQLVEPFVR